MEYSLPINDRAFNAIQKGTKKVEGRVPHQKDDLYSKMKQGDVVDFENEATKEHLKVRIEFVHHYPSIQSMLETEGVENVLSSEPKTVEHGIESYHSFSGYKENVVKFGIYAIGLKTTREN